MNQIALLLTHVSHIERPSSVNFFRNLTLILVGYLGRDILQSEFVIDQHFVVELLILLENCSLKPSFSFLRKAVSKSILDGASILKQVEFQ